MIDLTEHIKSYRRVKLKSNSIVYDIDKNLSTIIRKANQYGS